MSFAAGMCAPGFSACTPVIHAAGAPGSVAQHAGAEMKAAADMAEVGAELAAGADAANVVAGGAAAIEERLSTGLQQRGVGRLRVGGLAGEPSLECVRRLGDDVQRHLRVLLAAELGALAAVGAGRDRR